MIKKIVAFGEVVWDILPNGKVLGGTPSNLVYRCNSFSEQGFLLSRVGDDDLGKEAIEKLKELGISDDNVQSDTEFPTGTVFISFENNYDPRYIVTPDVAFDHIEFSAEALKLVRDADCLFYGLLPQRFGISKNTLRELIKESPDSLHFFDLKLFEHFFNVRVVENLLESSNIVRIKEKEISFLSRELGLNDETLNEFSEELSEKYKIDLILVTRGQNGVFAFHKKKGAFFDPGYSIEIVDNIGSGMAFSAGFLHYYLNGKPIQQALNFGNAAGALNTTKRGATSFFNKKDVVNFMKNTPKNNLI
ncbi:MAG TPA: PfkB family carbohydrate kinase [Draconibacterium sp.]|jgi:fructokinase|nr:PfkB family carbohydrate kinase [Draconibacterium sp.]